MTTKEYVGGVVGTKKPAYRQGNHQSGLTAYVSDHRLTVFTRLYRQGEETWVLTWTKGVSGIETTLSNTPIKEMYE